MVNSVINVFCSQCLPLFGKKQVFFEEVLQLWFRDLWLRNSLWSWWSGAWLGDVTRSLPTGQCPRMASPGDGDGNGDGVGDGDGDGTHSSASGWSSMGEPVRAAGFAAMGMASDDGGCWGKSNSTAEWEPELVWGKRLLFLIIFLRKMNACCKSLSKKKQVKDLTAVSLPTQPFYSREWSLVSAQRLYEQDLHLPKNVEG